MRLAAIETQPLYHVISQLVYASGRHQVSDVWIAGVRKLAERVTVDLDAASCARKRGAGAIGLPTRRSDTMLPDCRIRWIPRPRRRFERRRDVRSHHAVAKRLPRHVPDLHGQRHRERRNSLRRRALRRASRRAQRATLDAEGLKRLEAALATVATSPRCAPTRRSTRFCEMRATDNPSIVLSVVRGGAEKNIHYYLGCRGAAIDADLRRANEFGRAIDEILDTARWVGETDAALQ